MTEKKGTAKGLLMVFTGNGKGKTTSALGLAFRALGHKFPVSMIQFIKGNWKYGELDTVERLGDLMEIHVMGRGFTWKSDDLEKDRAAAQDAWEFAAQTIREGKHRLVILDELTYLIKYNMVEEEKILEVLRNRPKGMHIVVTGRDASDRLIEAADLVTEMREVKHPFAAGVSAQRGVEF